MSTYIVTGGAGFIGSHLIDLLLKDSSTREVRVIDNFSSGREEHLSHWSKDSRLKVYREDLLNLNGITPLFKGADFVYHLAANPDARWGIENTRLDLEQETIATYHVLESMRLTGCTRILLSSSGTVYGDVGTEVTHEKLGPALPISLYGAGKVASEALVSAFCGTFNLSGVILRFGNIVGERTTHGVIFDFIRKLAQTTASLEVLGDGYQSKPYVYVQDLTLALRYAEQLGRKLATGKFEVFNVAPSDATSVRFIAETLLKHLNLESKTQIQYGKTSFGWPGDVAHSRMSSEKLENAGYRLPRNSNQAVEEAIAQIIGWLKNRKDQSDGLRIPQ